MLSRRELLLAAVAAMLPAKVMASGSNASAAKKSLAWPEFQLQMTALATAEADRSIEHQAIAESGLRLLGQLDVHSVEFKEAVEASYETGNRYWLWQRLIKGRHINGGILNIVSDQLVQLHDHPGATGMLRIISGETEVWQFDAVTQEADQEKGGKAIAVLTRVSRRILKAGDTAVLKPDTGNIHALRAISPECSMLDFFIPPYQRSQRSWYEPLETNWFNKEIVACRKIPQHAYSKA